MNEDHGPAEPAGDDKEEQQPRGFAGLARWLNNEYPNRKRPISRQLVHKWFLYRHHNGFPAPVSPPGGGGSGRPTFDVEEVDRWYFKFRGSHGEPGIQRRTSQVRQDNPSTNSGGEKPLAA
jgi:hypothetical protein